MSPQRIFTISVVLLGMCGQSHASAGCPPSSNSGDIVIQPPPHLVAESTATESWEGGARFKPGKWLALACAKNDCKFEPVKLSVKTHRPKHGEESECLVSQTLTWDFSAVAAGTNVVMLFKPGAGLRAGAVKTWYVLDRSAGATFEPVKIGAETRVATHGAENSKRQSVVVPLKVKNKGCIKSQADNYRCLAESVRVQLREGSVRQWLGEQLLGMPWAHVCYTTQVESELHLDYLQWVGDLDNDQKPDYLLWLGWQDGYILFLSSRAAPGKLVGEAGRYYWPDIQCD